MEPDIREVQTAEEIGGLSSFERVLAAAGALGVLIVWIIAFWLSPDARGIGTHEQLGLAPCRLATIFRIPCVFCGMTTAFAHLAQGELVRALIAQPAGVGLAFLSFPAAFGAVWMSIRGVAPRWLTLAVQSPRSWKVLTAILVASWIYKVITFK